MEIKLSEIDIQKCPFCGEQLILSTGFYYHRTYHHMYACYVDYSLDDESENYAYKIEEFYSNLIDRYHIEYNIRDNIYYLGLWKDPEDNQLNKEVTCEVEIKLSTLNIVEANEKIRKIHAFI